MFFCKSKDCLNNPGNLSGTLVREDAGFTLVELMVVVAIIGILSAVAIPNFKRYQAKSKTSEAKLNLAAIYTAETALNGDYDSYGTCIEFMGYSRGTSDSYYAVGFAAKNATADAQVDANGNLAACGTTTACCNFAGAAYAFDAVKSVAGSTASSADLAASSTVADDGTAFVAEAAGKISGDNTIYDRWTIDENKTVSQSAIGY